MIRFERTRNDAVPPYKARESDTGYDLTVLSLFKRVGAVEFYNTGIIVEPPAGYYFELVPRSSITKSGYIMANSVGVIDSEYRGEILVPLINLLSSTPTLELPNRIVQLIPRPLIHFPVVEGIQVKETSRGTGGFGSTGTAKASDSPLIQAAIAYAATGRKGLL